MIFVPTEFEKFTADIRERMFLCPQKSVMRRMNNLLLLTRKEVHTQRLGFEFFDVLFSAAVIAAAEQGIVITVEIEEDICAEADRQVLECVLMNVLSNACAFSADSRVKVTVFLNDNETVVLVINKSTKTLLPPYGVSLGLTAAKTGIQLCGGNLSYFCCRDIVCCRISVPANNPLERKQVFGEAAVSAMLCDPYSSVRVGFSTLKKC